MSYDSTNFYLVQTRRGWLMIDTGWPGTIGKYKKSLRQNDVNLDELKYLMVTHFHPDHAGLVQDFKDMGVQLILHDGQAGFPDELKTFFHRKPQYPFKEIDHENRMLVSSEESRILLSEMGITGEIIATPGHSEDSVSLILDGRAAFTGDLTRTGWDGNLQVEASWERIREHRVERVYPGHGPSWSLDYPD